MSKDKHLGKATNTHSSATPFFAIILVIILAIFGILTLAQLDLPGLYYDEALDVVPTVQLLLGQPVQLERGVGIWLGKTAFPVMIMDYVGAVNTYLAIPFLALLGINVVALRLLTVVLSAVTLILAYRLGSRFFDKRIGMLATFLLAIHPSFVFWSRMGITVTSVMTVFSLGSLLCFLNWHEKKSATASINLTNYATSPDRRPNGSRSMGLSLSYRPTAFRLPQMGTTAWFALGCFLLGVGLWAKLLFLWWIVALAIIGGALWLWESKAAGKAPWYRLPLSLKEKAAGGAAFCLGASPLIWYNLVSGGTAITLHRNLITTEYGVNNLNFLGNLVTAWNTFRILLNGSYFWYQGGPFANDLYLPLFLISAAGAAILVLRRWREYAKAFFVSLAIIGLLILQSMVTVSGHWATHLFIAFPFPQLVIATFAVLAARSWPGVRKTLGGTLAAASILMPAIAGDLAVDWQYHATMSDIKGLATASNTIYKLADYLDKKGITRPLAADWGFSKNIQFLTQGRVNPEDIFCFGPQGRDIFRGEIRKYLADPNNIYLFHAKESTVYPRLDIFLEEAERMGRKVVIEEAFRQQDGVLLYLLVSAR